MAKTPIKEMRQNDAELEDENLDDEEAEQPSEVDKQFAKAEDINSLKEQLASMRELINTRQPTPTPAPTRQAPAAIDDVTDEELDEIIANGAAGGAKKLRKAMNAAAERRFRGLEERFEQLQEFGLTAIGDLSEKVSEGDQKYAKHPKLGPKIKAAQAEAAQYDPRVRSNPALLKRIHDMVVGENLDLVMADAQEEAARKTRDNRGGSEPTGATGRTTRKGADEVPSPKDLIGNDMTLDEADDWTKRILGYKGGWAEYAKVIAKQREGMNS